MYTLTLITQKGWVCVCDAYLFTDFAGSAQCFWPCRSFFHERRNTFHDFVLRVCVLTHSQFNIFGRSPLRVWLYSVCRVFSPTQHRDFAVLLVVALFCAALHSYTVRARYVFFSHLLISLHSLTRYFHVTWLLCLLTFMWLCEALRELFVWESMHARAHIFYALRRHRCCHRLSFLTKSPQHKREYALNLNISVSAAEQKKLTRIPLVAASEQGFNQRIAYFTLHTISLSWEICVWVILLCVFSPKLNPILHCSTHLCVCWLCWMEL